MVLQYYAHVRESANSDKEYQTVARHLTGTAELCRGFAAAFGTDADGDLAGLATTSVNAQKSFKTVC